MSMLVLREEIAWLCGGHLVAALILNQFVFWESIDRIGPDDWHPVSGAELEDELFGCVSARTAKRALNDLHDMGVLNKRPGRGSDRRGRYQISDGARMWLCRFDLVSGAQNPIGQIDQCNGQVVGSIGQNDQCPLDRLTNDPITQRSSKIVSAAREDIVVVDFEPEVRAAAFESKKPKHHRMTDELVAMFDIYLGLTLDPTMADQALETVDDIMGQGYGEAYMLHRISDDFGNRTTRYRSPKAVLNMILSDAADTPDARRERQRQEQPPSTPEPVEQPEPVETTDVEPEPVESPTTVTPCPKANDVWSTGLGVLERSVSEHAMDNWFRGLVAVGLDGGVLRLMADESFRRQWIEQHYTRLLEDCCGCDVEIVERADVQEK